MSTPDLFDRAVALAQQRAQLLAWANDPDTPTHKADQQVGPTTRRQVLCRVRAVERVIAGIAEIAAFKSRMAAEADSSVECTCAARDMPFGRCCKATGTEVAHG